MNYEPKNTHDSKVLKDYANMQRKAKNVFDESLDFIDELPDPPKRPEMPFPFGSDKVRPYGMDFPDFVRIR